MDIKEKVLNELAHFCREADSNTNFGERADTMDKFADNIVKLFTIPDVSNNGVAVCDCKWVKGCNLCGIGRIRIEDCIDYVKQTDC